MLILIYSSHVIKPVGNFTNVNYWAECQKSYCFIEIFLSLKRNLSGPDMIQVVLLKNVRSGTDSVVGLIGLV